MKILSKYWYVTSFIVGALSGLASYGSFSWEASQTSNLVKFFNYEGYIPYSSGLLFGLVSYIYFLIFLRQQKSFIQSFLWIVFCTLSFTISFMFSSLNVLGKEQITIFTSMGFVGGVFILFAFNFFVTKLNMLESLLLVIITTLIPTCLVLLGEDLYQFSFIPWQAAVMVVFAHAINRSNQSFVADEVNRIQNVQEAIITQTSIAQTVSN